MAAVVGHGAGGEGAAALQLLPEPVIKLLDIRLGGNGQVDGEAVAVETVDPQAGAGQFLQGVRHLAQHLVAVLPAVADVDVAQVVHAHQQQIAGTAGAEDGADVLHQFGAVESAGEGIHFPLQRGVRDPAHHHGGGAVLVEVAPPPAADPDPVAAAVHQAVFHIVFSLLAPADAVQILRQGGQILFIDDAAPVRYRAVVPAVVQNRVAAADVAGEIQPLGLVVAQKEIVVGALPDKAQHIQLRVPSLVFAHSRTHGPCPPPRRSGLKPRAPSRTGDPPGRMSGLTGRAADAVIGVTTGMSQYTVNGGS